MGDRTGIKVFAPASVANLGVGYDILGLCLNDIGDEIIVRKGKKPGLHIKTIYKNKSLSKDIKKNTAGYAAYRLLESLNLTEEPIEIDLFKNMSIGTGLGSSAASAVAGVFGVNSFLGSPYTKAEILRFATEGEQVADGSFHADNVAPSLLGGIILIRDNESLDWTKLPTPRGLLACVIYPKVQVLTSESRAILSENVSLDSVIAQTGNLATFVAGLFKSDFDLIKKSMTDHIIEPQRAHLIPHFAEMKKQALACDALGFSISGAGPSMFALCNNTIIAENIAEKAQQLYSDQGIECECFISEINPQGAIKY